MRRGIVRSIGVAIAAGALTLTAAAPASAAPPDFTGIIALDNCSGSLVKPPGAQDTDPALAMTNGHCNSGGFLGPGEVLLDEPTDRSMTLLGGDGAELGSLRATKISYATMTDTDVALYELDSTYAQIAERTGGAPLAMSAEPPANGTAISVVSGYFTRTWSCSIDTTVHELREADWTWRNSVRYTPECDTIHGTSGAPVIDDATKQVVAINNTGNDDGGECTLNNPCEVDEQGNVFFKQGLTYGQQTNAIVGCMAPGNQIDLAKPGCALPKPAAA